MRPGHDPFETRPPLSPDELDDPSVGNRFDSPLGNYSVLYFGTSLEVCFGETLAAFGLTPPSATLSRKTGPNLASCHRER